MKRILIATAVLMGFGCAANAQTSGSSAPNAPTVSPTQTKGKKGKKVEPTDMNQRKTYHWKDGQRATPTGHEATGLGSSAAPLPKDSAIIVTDSTRQQPR